MSTATPPARQLIEDHLRGILASPQTTVGTLLPTVAELCEKFGVAGTGTVQSGYAPLVREGLVEVVYAPRRRWVVKALPALAGPTLADVHAEITAARHALARAESLLERLAS